MDENTPSRASGMGYLCFVRFVDLFLYFGGLFIEWDSFGGDLGWFQRWDGEMMSGVCLFVMFGDDACQGEGSEDACLE